MFYNQHDAMATSDILTLIGLGLGTVGGIMLAYDVVYGPGKRFQANNLKTQLRLWREMRTFVQNSIKSTKAHPLEEIQKELEKEEQDNGPKEHELVKQNEE